MNEAETRAEHIDPGRYYQDIAVTRMLEEIAAGKPRILRWAECHRAVCPREAGFCAFRAYYSRPLPA